MQNAGHTRRGGSWQGRDAVTNKPVEVIVDGERIAAVHEITDRDDLPWISAGWIDLQVNGCGGGDLNDERVEAHDVKTTTAQLWAKGVARYMPTVITGSYDRMSRAMRVIADACETDARIAASVGGIHMEGPYISSVPGPLGAHPAGHVRAADTDEFARLQEAAGGRIGIVTLAPEQEGAIGLIRRMAADGIVASIGHSAADSAAIAAAVEAGATMSTHLGNGSHLMLPRHPNYIWDQLAEDRLTAGFIADGHHVPAAALRAMLRAKGEHCFLVSDCVALAGMPPGIYGSEIGEQVILQEDGRLCRLDNRGILAGSASTLDVGVRMLVRELGWTLADAIAMVTSRPARAMGWSRHGRLEPGAAGDLTLFRYPHPDAPIRIVETVAAGLSVYGDGSTGDTEA